jgi:hypothetical protein
MPVSVRCDPAVRPDSPRPPFARNLHGFAKKALDGWQLSTIMTFQSGFPAPSRPTSTPPAPASARAPTRFPASAATAGDHARGRRGSYRGFRAGSVWPLRTSLRTDAVRPGITNVTLDHQVGAIHRNQVTRIPLEFFNFLKNYNPDPATLI